MEHYFFGVWRRGLREKEKEEICFHKEKVLKNAIYSSCFEAWFISYHGLSRKPENLPGRLREGELEKLISEVHLLPGWGVFKADYGICRMWIWDE